jgi:arylsulfatase A-like enzyme
VIEGRQDQRMSRIGFQTKGQRAWVGQRYKLVQPSKNAAWELYDLQQDAAETVDLAATHGEMVRAMQAEFQTWQSSCQRSDAGADYRE